MQPGARLGPDEIVAPLSAGAMGEVYRARDRCVDRDEALQILRCQPGQRDAAARVVDK